MPIASGVCVWVRQKGPILNKSMSYPDIYYTERARTFEYNTDTHMSNDFQQLTYAKCNQIVQLGSILVTSREKKKIKKSLIHSCCGFLVNSFLYTIKIVNRLWLHLMSSMLSLPLELDPFERGGSGTCARQNVCKSSFR